jgi:homocysteine S-methyltransferase
MDRSTFRDRLQSEILLGDGGMGSFLYVLGFPYSISFDGLNLTAPDKVKEVHAAYVRAGAQVIETNTFGANRVRLAPHGLQERVVEINRRGVEIARQAAGSSVWVAASVGPLGSNRKGRDPELTDGQKREIFREQIQSLVAAGPDFIMLETFTQLRDLLLALAVCRDCCDLPVVCQMAFADDGRTFTGVSVEQVARELEAAGADVVGTNCVMGPFRTLEVVDQICRAVSVPVSAFPNAGAPTVVDGRYLYLSSPEYFADYAERMAEVGANFVGGCCGISAPDIRELAGRLKGKRPASRQGRLPARPASRPAAEKGVESPGSFLERRRDGMLVTVELDPPKDMDYERILSGARLLAEDGRVSVVNVADNPLGVVRMSNTVMAHLIQEKTGMETIIHVSCRDRNLIGLRSDLMGAWTLGLRNLFPVTGDPASIGGEPGAASVYDTNSIGLLEMVRGMNEKRQTAFTVGVALNPVGRLEPHIRRLEKKKQAGAQYVMTQPMYDIERARELCRLTAEVGLPLFFGIMPLVSERNAEFLHNEVPGIEIPVGVRKRMKGLRGKAGQEMGLEITRDILEGLRGEVSAFYIIPPFENAELALRVVDVVDRVIKSACSSV